MGVFHKINRLVKHFSVQELSKSNKITQIRAGMRHGNEVGASDCKFGTI